MLRACPESFIGEFDEERRKREVFQLRDVV